MKNLLLVIFLIALFQANVAHSSLGEIIVSGDTQAGLDAKVNAAIALEGALISLAVDL